MKKVNEKTNVLPMILFILSLFIFQSCQKGERLLQPEESRQVLQMNDLSRSFTAFSAIMERMDKDYNYPTNVPSEEAIKNDSELLKLMEEYDQLNVKIQAYELTEKELYEAASTLSEEGRIQVYIPEELSKNSSSSASIRNNKCVGAAGNRLLARLTLCSSGGIAISLIFSAQVRDCVNWAHNSYALEVAACN